MKTIIKKILVIALVLTLLMSCSSCKKLSGSFVWWDPFGLFEHEENGFSNRGTQIQVTEASVPSLQTSVYDGGYFSIELPVGWVIQTGGQYASFCLRAYDPNCPSRQIFYFGKLEPFMKSVGARQVFEYYYSMTHEPTSLYFSTAIVLDPATVPNFYMQFSQIESYAHALGETYDFPNLNDFQAFESMPFNSPFASIALDDTILRAYLTGENGDACEGMFSATIVSPGTNYNAGYDTAPLKVYNAMGVMAPVGEFCWLEQTLCRCVSSLTFSEEYVQQGIALSNWETQVALSISQQLSAAYDSYNSAWSARNQTYDTLSQQYSDATLGYDRVVDSETGSVYRIPVGSYSTYDSNRYEYNNPNLQLLGQDDYYNYAQPIEGYLAF